MNFPVGMQPIPVQCLMEYFFLQVMGRVLDFLHCKTKRACCKSKGTVTYDGFLWWMLLGWLKLEPVSKTAPTT